MSFSVGASGVVFVGGAVFGVVFPRCRGEGVANLIVGLAFHRFFFGFFLVDLGAGFFLFVFFLFLLYLHFRRGFCRNRGLGHSCITGIFCVGARFGSGLRMCVGVFGQLRRSGRVVGLLRERRGFEQVDKFLFLEHYFSLGYWLGLFFGHGKAPHGHRHDEQQGYHGGGCGSHYARCARIIQFAILLREFVYLRRPREPLPREPWRRGVWRAPFLCRWRLRC